mmetsp:Transcript_16021/g.53691  ORF Transcript_16021/g.53691 Transcript_16021/m.53691 type:complete len:229 (-) Transcript_16021:3216-3902(-)
MMMVSSRSSDISRNEKAKYLKKDMFLYTLDLTMLTWIAGLPSPFPISNPSRISGPLSVWLSTCTLSILTSNSKSLRVTRYDVEMSSRAPYMISSNFASMTLTPTPDSSTWNAYLTSSSSLLVLALQDTLLLANRSFTLRERVGPSANTSAWMPPASWKVANLFILTDTLSFTPSIFMLITCASCGRSQHRGARCPGASLWTVSLEETDSMACQYSTVLLVWLSTAYCG